MICPRAQLRARIAFGLTLVGALFLLAAIGIVSAAAQDASSDGSTTTLRGGVSYDDNSGGTSTDYFGGDSTGGGDTFNSNSDSGGGGDTFNSNSDNGGSAGGDVFSSNSGDGERPQPYPTPPPSFPCGPNPLENQAWGGAAASTFLEGFLRPLIEPHCTGFVVPRRSRPIFTYFYINGINTPRTKDLTESRDNWRGSCLSEHDTVAQNLIDRRDQVTWPQVPVPVGPLAPIKVANEIDNMFGLTCNPSGQDPWSGIWFGQNCGQPFVPAARFRTVWWNVPACQFLSTANGIRSGALIGMPLTPGDLIESIVQSTTPPIFRLFGTSFPLLPSGINNTANNSLVASIADTIVRSYRSEMARKANAQPVNTNYFILIGHSQGNFFVEGVAYRLYTRYGADGQRIFWTRLGIISLASPTSYDSLPPQFIATKVKHRTRADDAINILTPISQGLASLRPFAINGKRPWPMNETDAPLWSFTPAALQYVFSLDSLRPPGGCGVVNWSFQCDIGSAPFWQLMGSTPTEGVDNAELYAPFLNSHLLDNYLDDPPATGAGQHLSPNLYKYLGPNHGFGPYSPPAPPLLNTIRSDLFQLKRSLLQSSPGTLQARMP